MSRLDQLLRWVLEPKHAGKTLFLINNNDIAIGPNWSDQLVYIKRDRDGRFEMVASLDNTELVQIVAGFSEIA